MPNNIKNWLAAAFVVSGLLSQSVVAEDLERTLQRDYDGYLRPLFAHFYRNPELSMMENKTAARLATELREAGIITVGTFGSYCNKPRA
ncbi:MAG: hypothetical protein O7F73_02265 [Gammaproteobacteria bacterium]|nr:hypothetical protein [Gammaproteobacteria bacterium]